MRPHRVTIMMCFALACPLMAWTGVPRFAVNLSRLPITREAAWLRVHATPSDTLAVWGFRPDIYVESRVRPGNHDAESSMKDRFVADIERDRPTFVVDAVARAAWLWNSDSAIADRTRGGYETFPPLKRVVDEWYIPATEITYGKIPGNAVRIFRLREMETRAESEAGDTESH